MKSVTVKSLQRELSSNELAEKIFSVDKNIRYLGVTGLGPDYEIKVTRMREGVKSLTPADEDRGFLGFIPEIILGIGDKLKDHLGGVGYALLCFQKVTLMLFRTPECFVVLGLEAGTFARPIYEKLSILLDLKQTRAESSHS